MRLRKSLLRFFIFILFLILATTCSRPAAVGWDHKEIITDVEAIRNTHHIPAIAVVVIQADTVLQGTLTGVRSIENVAQPTPNDIFHLGSLSKTITATIIASLVEEGLLSWESRPEDIFPEWKNDIHPALREINLDMMLRHSSGLTGYLDDDSPEVQFLPPMPDDPVAARQAFARYALQHAPLFTPGSRRKYSNAGYALAAAMAEKVSGVSWEKLARERLFTPLGMDNTTFGQPAEAALIRGHIHDGDTLEVLRPKGSYEAAWRHPAENVYTSLRDYVSFLQIQLQGLRGHNGLLQDTTVQYLHEPMGIDSEGLGWNIEKSEDLKRSFSSSRRHGFYHSVQLQAEKNMGVFIFGSSMRETDKNALDELMNQLYNQYSSLPSKNE